jgi:hypothetical protein
MQRAFRQRKEGYIKKLEEQVRDFAAMQESYKQIQSENFQLRDYIIALQSRLIESQGEDAVPPAPPVLVQQHPPPPPMMLMDAAGAPSAAASVVQQAGQQVQVPAPQPPQVGPAPQVQMQPSAPHTTHVRVPISAAPVHQSVISEIAAAGHKRPHDPDTDLLQSIAQAAGTTSNGYNMAAQPAAAAAPAPAVSTRKSRSPNAKRIKGEKLETPKTEQSGVVDNGL